ncbi:CDP-alcohol phosphatidyltransferase family protein [Guptibacillus hwajinpoensis]|uniref:CDP-alcohol phosphatidyltransferase n=1 Tax=Guptibacillus hwajinpoensis TaxID=208199 RepID=A0A0J6D1B0_9BACL|nr:CDP-alcohol phosphatidyltransferase family protein [Alkalihalobacillus macyae]KMM38064.1 CDP-alcohol phosphatidyltransferase [Alkalihalobacillus macyae]MDP4552721.1 CDP-alcohol phosphatidyltransferase family protein [Alkalihalobacillus macyae]
MLDTHARKYVQPIMDRTADVLLRVGLTANQVTTISFIIGVTSGLFIYLDQFVIAVVVLWLSGFLDAVDGTMARKTKPSSFGTILDVSFDRVVEVSVILGLAFRFPDSMWALLLLSTSIIFAMTIFLTVGAVSEKKGIKSFYYQAGAAERTEGFILFTAMILFHDVLTLLTLVFLAIELFTAFQRLAEAKRILD